MERAKKTQRLLSNFLRFQEDEDHMAEILISNEQLIEGSKALQEVSTLCSGLKGEEYGIVIERVQKRVQSVVDKLMESLQEAGMAKDVLIDFILSTLASATCPDCSLSVDFPERCGCLPDLHSQQF